jgi:hypothetical protein
MDTFSEEKTNFKKNGTYNYQFDEGGNLVFNKKSSQFEQHYVAIPLVVYGYDANKISTFHDLEFKEFVPVSNLKPVPAVEDLENNTLRQENESLKTQLNDLINSPSDTITESERLAFKQVILELRTRLGQGSDPHDFSETFPYFPVIKTP